MEKFIIAKDIVKRVKRFNMIGRTLEFKIKPIPVSEEPVKWVKDAVNQIIEKCTEGLKASDQVGFSFCSKNFRLGDAWIAFREASKVTYTDIWDIISSIYQSNSTGLNTETFCLSVTSVKMPAGKGNDRGRRYNSFEEECNMRRGIITINNKDDLCLPRSLIVAIAYVNKDPMWNKVRKDTGKLQTQRALKLVEESAIVIPQEGCGIPQLEQFQRTLQNYKIVVYTYGNKGRDVMFDGCSDGKKLNLLYHKGHYNVITSLTSAFCTKYYCEECHVPYEHNSNHRCGGTCFCCQKSPPCPKALNVKCTECKRSFRGQICYDNHKRSGSLGKGTVCGQIRLCTDCLKTVKSDRKHYCGEIFCKICNTHVPQDHLCYIQPDNGKPKTRDVLFIFYDLETRQEKILEDGAHQHEPNLCVFRQCCDDCMETNISVCQKCGVRLQIVKGANPVASFMHHMLIMRKIFKQVICLAHNSQAFDGQFILNYVLTQTDLNPELIMRGTKIISMMVGNVKFLDSLNYLPMALSKLPKAFGLGDNFKKGYFPHLFNTEENKNYIGPLPDVEFYDSDNMKDDAREKFLEWYKIHRNDEFDMQRDLIDYCISDVEILTAACLKFRKQLLEAGGVCPFTEACTIASACNKVFRRNFLKPNTIGIIPKGGYRWRDNQSKTAVQWLVWEEHQRQINITHTAKQQEAKIHGVKVDGYCAETNQIFEFHGCYYHGCLVCLKHNRDDPLHDDPLETLNMRYESTTAKTERLRELGYEVIEMWECEFKRQIQTNENIAAYTNTHPLVISTPLNPRDAFYGGRTGNTFEYYKVKEGEKIKYVDVCSLYPFICKYGKFPIGHPEVYVGEECRQLDLEKMCGSIKCKILPPTDLYHPVLPVKMNNKLMFVLCQICGLTMSQTICNHTDEERTLTGTWIIDEVIKAVQMGYKILQVYEVWSYQSDQFNKSKNMGGLFTEMMNKFIKIKQQASGWPHKCTTNEQRYAYIEEFFEIENIKLEFAEILDNPGLRSLAKLILNSFWGKFAQRENQPKTKIVREPCELFGMFTDPEIYVNALVPIGDEAVVVNYEHREEAYQPLSTVNVMIAGYVTAQARLKLYSYLEKLGDRVLYYDTDSVIYVSRPGEFDVPTGEFIGDMTDELESYGADSYIKEFACGGPKNYGFKVQTTQDNKDHLVCKVKGISINYETSHLINFDSIKDMVLNDAPPVYIVSKNIRRTKEHDVVTRTEMKIYKAQSNKRIFYDDHSSMPYGYKKLKI